MIRLGKDKVDERFNILPDGTIVDLNGNIQKTKIARNRPWFKGVKVHQIQMWTNYGWRDTRIWDIHHLDEDKQNNALSNLIFMTKSEHISLHHKGTKHPHSEDSKRKMSESHKGMNTWTKSLYWFNNGVKNYRCKECPPGCVKGRIGWKWKERSLHLE